MSDLLTGFARFTRPNSPYSESYKGLVSYYSNFANISQGFKLVIARMQGELDKLEAKAKLHDSESLRQLIAGKAQQIKEAEELLDKDRETYFSEGMMNGERVKQNMTLFSATA